MQLGLTLASHLCEYVTMVPSFLAADPANVNMFIWLRLMSQLFLHKQSVT